MWNDPDTLLCLPDTVHTPTSAFIATIKPPNNHHGDDELATSDFCNFVESAAETSRRDPHRQTSEISLNSASNDLSTKTSAGMKVQNRSDVCLSEVSEVTKLAQAGLNFVSSCSGLIDETTLVDLSIVKQDFGFEADCSGTGEGYSLNESWGVTRRDFSSSRGQKETSSVSDVVGVYSQAADAWFAESRLFDLVVKQEPSNTFYAQPLITSSLTSQFSQGLNCGQSNCGYETNETRSLNSCPEMSHSSEFDFQNSPHLFPLPYCVNFSNSLDLIPQHRFPPRPGSRRRRRFNRRLHIDNFRNQFQSMQEFTGNPGLPIPNGREVLPWDRPSATALLPEVAFHPYAELASALDIDASPQQFNNDYYSYLGRLNRTQRSNISVPPSRRRSSRRRGGGGGGGGPPTGRHSSFDSANSDALMKRDIERERCYDEMSTMSSTSGTVSIGGPDYGVSTLLSETTKKSSIYRELSVDVNCPNGDDSRSNFSSENFQNMYGGKFNCVQHRPTFPVATTSYGKPLHSDSPSFLTQELFSSNTSVSGQAASETGVKSSFRFQRGNSFPSPSGHREMFAPYNDHFVNVGGCVQSTDQILNRDPCRQLFMTPSQTPNFMTSSTNFMTSSTASAYGSNFGESVKHLDKLHASIDTISNVHANGSPRRQGVSSAGLVSATQTALTFQHLTQATRMQPEMVDVNSYQDVLNELSHSGIAEPRNPIIADNENEFSMAATSHAGVLATGSGSNVFVQRRGAGMRFRWRRRIQTIHACEHQGCTKVYSKKSHLKVCRKSLAQGHCTPCKYVNIGPMSSVV